jgi:hypothetical protein
MTALLQCANSNGWCAWGLSQKPGQMIGTSAIVVRACPACPTGAPESFWSPVQKLTRYYLN